MKSVELTPYSTYEKEKKMDISILAPLIRMLERSLIVAGGILSIYLGYKLFVMGIDKSQGEAVAFGIELKNFGPGLFFAALGAIILVTTMRAAIKVSPDVKDPLSTGNLPATNITETHNPEKPTGSTAIFFGMEDTKRVANQWTDTAFFLETRQLLRRLDQGESTDDLMNLRNGLKTKLNSITMSKEEYARFLKLTNKLPLNEQEQKELTTLERKLFP